VHIFRCVGLLLVALVCLDAASAEAARNRSPLAPHRFDQPPFGSVRPHGWLTRHLCVQADGRSGHLDEFWPDLGPNSGWLGGTGESWERGPYYLDGLIPLAYLLDDQRFLGKPRRWMEWTLTHQRPDGSFGPEKKSGGWPNMIKLKALSQYQEAFGDVRVIPLMQRYFAYQFARDGVSSAEGVGRIPLGR